MAVGDVHFPVDFALGFVECVGPGGGVFVQDDIVAEAFIDHALAG